jgi:hypothetical protein
MTAEVSVTSQKKSDVIGSFQKKGELPYNLPKTSTVYRLRWASLLNIVAALL